MTRPEPRRGQDLRLALRQVRYENRAFRRNPTAAIFIVFFPLLFLFVFGGRGGQVENFSGVNYHQYFVPAMLAYGLMNASYTNLAMQLTLRRENGLLKRARTTPLPAWASFAGMLGNMITVGVAISTVVLVVGFAVFDLQWYGRWIAVLITCLLALITFASLGAAISTFVPNEEAAAPVVNIVYFLLIFTSGTFFAIDPKSTLHEIADYFPVARFNDAIIRAFVPFRQRGPGSGIQWHDLRVLAIWGIAGAFVAIRRWRWEPRRT